MARRVDMKVPAPSGADEHAPARHPEGSIEHDPSARSRPRQVLAGLDQRVVGWAIVLFAVFLVVERVVFRTSRLPIGWYDDGSILLGTLRSPIVIVGWLSGAALVAARPGLAWHRCEFGFRLLQIPTVAIVASLTWHLSTLEYNFALGHGFGADRLVLVALALACCVHPGALAAFVVFAHAVTGQLNVAPMFFSWTDTMVLHQLLLVVLLAVGAAATLPIAEQLVHRFDRLRPAAMRLPVPLKIPAASVWAVFVGVFGSWYLRSAMGKTRLNWLPTNDLSNIVRAARQQHGWLGSLDADQFEQIASFVGQWRIPIQIGALAAEFAVLAYFFSRRVSLIVATLAIALHTMVYLTTGILFWKWMVVNVALMAVFVLADRSVRRGRPVFSKRKTMMIATVIVMVAHALVSPRVTELAWYDSTFVYRFEFQAIGRSGQVYEVLPEQFAPWDSRFGQSRWYFATDEPLLVDVFGSIKSRSLLDALEQADTVAETEAVIDRFGRPVTDMRQTRQFESFLRTFLAFTERPGAPNVLGLAAVRAPHHLWTGQPPQVSTEIYDWGEPLVDIRMTLTSWNRIDDEYVEISRAEVLQIGE